MSRGLSPDPKQHNAIIQMETIPKPQHNIKIIKYNELSKDLI